ncbi:hypothetical protein ACFX13_024168 [Malus domestica]
MDSSNHLELTLSLKLANIENVSQKLSVLNEHLQKHQEELRKLEAFRTEMPHSVLLLSDAVQVLKNEISELSDHQSERRSAFRKYKSSSPPFNPKPYGIDTTDHKQVMTSQCSQSSSRMGMMVNKEPTSPTPFPCDLNMAADDFELESKPQAQPESQPQPQLPLPLPLPNLKNKRRSWTPELHARFLKAMSLLGGPQEATPKQIQAVMQVDGLTHDQVKSHLQKYRLNNRGVQPASAASGQRAPHFYRDYWQQQQQLEGARNGGVRVGVGSSNGGGRSRDISNKKAKTSR